MRWRAPGPTLSPFVEQYWITTWDLRGRPPHLQRVLPSPQVNLTFKRGRSRVAGVVRGQFTELLEGRHVVVGVRFRPAGFRPFLGAPVSTITDRFVPVEQIFGPAGRALEDPVVAAASVDQQIRLVEEFLGSRVPRLDPTIDLVAGAVDIVATDPLLLRVDELADRLELNVRTLQRLFAEYVGVGPKWVIRRYRLREAAARAADGVLNWAQVAADLGYSDQAHLSRDFTACVGRTPAQYARRCAGE